MNHPFSPKEVFLKADHQEGVKSARKLLNRPAPSGYVEEWNALVSRSNASTPTVSHLSVVIFRLNGEWFSLATQVFKDVCEARAVHSVPHKKGKLLKGLVNISGQIRLCVSLYQLLDIKQPEQKKHQDDPTYYHRLVVIEKEGETWVFKADEIYGTFCLNTKELEVLPATVTKSSNNYLKGVFNWNHARVALIDDELLFFTLKRDVL